MSEKSTMQDSSAAPSGERTATSGHQAETSTVEDQASGTTTTTGSAPDGALQGTAEANEEPYGAKTVEVEGVKITQYGKVRVLENVAELSKSSGARAETGYLSEDEIDEDLPPTLRFIAPEDVMDTSDPNMTHLEWLGTQGQKVTVITNVEHLVNLESFCLRSNFVRECSALAPLTQLVTLELYENRLNSLKGVECLVNLTTLDISYNRLRKLDPAILASLTKLEKLYVAQNKISKIEGLDTLTNLKVLDLGMNRIKEMEGLESLVNLEELWLGRNKIEQIKGLDTLTSLVRLSVQSNRLRSIGQGLMKLTALEELYLSHQGIIAFEGLDATVHSKLDTLDVSNNLISSLNGLPKLPALKELWMSYNKIATYEEVDKLQPFGNILETLYLDHNPIADDFEYRQRLAKTVPSLTQIDATMRFPRTTIA
eukprot:CAMPEP_0184542266 /NCGR_PEP_ID=MMETSP0199_2-20130426/1875_1 /TAXON_ID=1112570 /ORGANISM="Thraustochytrium sp., Strain LLF1b" /LENGTH=426 /DNA_ID=CAMNT_0026936037 /DNA_START=25 /DNA_END=1302 /DNA_ORIENTATION=+